MELINIFKNHYKEKYTQCLYTYNIKTLIQDNDLVYKDLIEYSINVRKRKDIKIFNFYIYDLIIIIGLEKFRYLMCKCNLSHKIISIINDTFYFTNVNSGNIKCCLSFCTYEYLCNNLDKINRFYSPFHEKSIFFSRYMKKNYIVPNYTKNKDNIYIDMIYTLITYKNINIVYHFFPLYPMLVLLSCISSDFSLGIYFISYYYKDFFECVDKNIEIKYNMISYIFNNPSEYLFSFIKTFCPFFYINFNIIGTIISINNGIFKDDIVFDENYGYDHVELVTKINKNLIFISKIFVDLFQNDKEKYIHCVKKLIKISKFYFSDILEEMNWIYFFKYLIGIHPDTIHNVDLIYWSYDKNYNDLLNFFLNQHNIKIDKNVMYKIKIRKFSF